MTEAHGPRQGGFAYLSITSKLPLQAITDHLGRAPDRKNFSIGEPRKRPGLKPYSFSRWSMASGLDEADESISVEEHLRSLWGRMQSIREQVFSAPPEFERWLVAVGYFDRFEEPLSVSGGHFATAAYYRLNLDFDFYFGDDFGHDDYGGGAYWDWEGLPPSEGQV